MTQGALEGAVLGTDVLSGQRIDPTTDGRSDHRLTPLATSTTGPGTPTPTTVPGPVVRETALAGDLQSAFETTWRERDAAVAWAALPSPMLVSAYAPMRPTR